MPYFVLLLLIPLLAFVGLWTVGKRVNSQAGAIATLATAFGLGVCVFGMYQGAYFTHTWEWATLGSSKALYLSLQMDKINALLLVMVHVVALLVQFYSAEYLSDEPHLHRYFAFLQLFLFSMVGILLSGSLLVMYIFWELVGLSSYLLIGFWLYKPRAVWAAKKAFLLNRIGDVAFLSGILLLFFHVGTTEFAELPERVAALPPGITTVIGLCLAGGCIGKSAQFPLSGWLPDAMEGPTPVSALIHAATMVAAGIFLLGRIAFLFTPKAEFVLLLIGTLTMLQGAVRAMRAWDIKQVLAYSTISQLGLMVVAVGFGSWSLALFHLLTHAFFKAGLFLAAGSVIHSLIPATSDSSSDPQNLRQMGGLRQRLPVTSVVFGVCAASLAGLPFFSGFLSKDAIFIAGFGWAERLGGGVAYLFPLAALLASALTAYYMLRLFWLIFEGEPRFEVAQRPHLHEGGYEMKGPLLVLAVFSAFFWFSLNPLEASHGWVAKWLDFAPMEASWLIPLASIALTGATLWWGYRQALQTQFLRPPSPFLGRSFWQRDWRIPLRVLSDFSAPAPSETIPFLLIPFIRLAHWITSLESRLIDPLVKAASNGTVILAHLVTWLDRHLIDGAIRGLTRSLWGMGAALRLSQSGKVQSYFVLIFTGLLLGLIGVIVWGIG